jgi:alkylation response protein AidB-like acyl-CoA dehydrogenase
MTTTREDIVEDAPGGSARQLRRRVRDVIAESGIELYAMCDAWMRSHDPRFTSRLADAGLIGLSWPAAYGGGDATHVDRLVVTEELLRVGAPVAAHWIADRQIGPAIMRHGTEALKGAFLPKIASGEITCCLGMSETESGSDLAKVRTRAVQDGDRFRITGRKIWTSHAHRSTHAYVLARTDETGNPHDGLTEFVVDLGSQGVSVRPIHDLAGEHHFNETIFEDVVVPASQVIGEIGNGWKQVTEQLAFERGGMERVLSTYPLLARLLGDDSVPVDDEVFPALGELVARLHTLRAMAYEIAGAMDAGDAPVRQAAMLKYLGTTFEGDVVDAACDILGHSPDPAAGGFEGLVAGGVLSAPGATLRGGATEVLLSIIGRAELPGVGKATPGSGSVLRRLADDVLSRRARQESAADDPGLWSDITELGWTGIGIPEESGGSGGELADLAEIVTALAFHGQSAPVAETALAGRLLASAGRTVDPSLPLTLALDATCAMAQTPTGRVLRGCVSRVPWGRTVRTVLVVAEGPDGSLLVAVPADAPGLSVEPGSNVAGEPRDTIVLDGIALSDHDIIGGPEAVAIGRQSMAVLQAAALAGAVEAGFVHACDHVQVREQFGRPLAVFQAVSHAVARMAAELHAVRTAVDQAIREVEAGGSGWRAVVARIVAARAASVVAKSSHQLLGAMGITREHDLHVATLRMWSWRDEHVPARRLSRRLGQAAFDAGHDNVWDWCVHDIDSLGVQTVWGTT